MQTILETRQIRIPAVLEFSADEFDTEMPKPHLWTRDDYYKMAEIGLFEGKRVELIEGEIIEPAAMKSYHATSVTLARDILQDIFSAGFVIRAQLPIFVNENSEPEPDIAVVKGKVRDYVEEHPRTAILAVEISDATLYQDRNKKAKIYAQIGIQDYWIVNLKSRQLEVYRQPVNGIYTEKQILKESELISPLAAPEAKIKVADLLP